MINQHEEFFLISDFFGFHEEEDIYFLNIFEKELMTTLLTPLKGNMKCFASLSKLNNFSERRPCLGLGEGRIDPYSILSSPFPDDRGKLG